MFKRANEELAEAREKGRLQTVWQERLERMRKDLAIGERKQRLWEEQLAREERDVEKLTRLSFSSVLYTLLESAKNWGTYDMLGGGLMSTQIKHNRMDDAMDAIRRAQNSLYRFEQELKDVRVTLDIRINMSGFLKFSDYFFDGLVSDWIVQGKIKDTLAQVSQKRSEVCSVTDGLEKAKRHAESELALTVRQYEMLIETSEDVR